MEQMDLLGYCGVWCGDCTGYTGAVADAASRLFEALGETEFAKTARAVFPDALAGVRPLRRDA